jgi:hypothetical protein
VTKQDIHLLHKQDAMLPPLLVPAGCGGNNAIGPTGRGMGLRNYPQQDLWTVWSLPAERGVAEELTELRPSILRDGVRTTQDGQREGLDKACDMCFWSENGEVLTGPGGSRSCVPGRERENQYKDGVKRA